MHQNKYSNSIPKSVPVPASNSKTSIVPKWSICPLKKNATIEKVVQTENCTRLSSKTNYTSVPSKVTSII